MALFDKRVAYKPFEYPQTMEFVKVLLGAFWTWEHFNFDKDVSDYKSELNAEQREVVRKSILAISQIEVSVKTFWGDLSTHIPKPEFHNLGSQLAHNEMIHGESYSKILEVLGLNEEFEKVLEVPEIQGRIDYLTKYIKGTRSNPKQNYALSMALFSAFVENCSLFSQFYIIKKFHKEYNYFDGVDNVISATCVEEDLHHKVGVYIINIIREEYPDYFDDDFDKKIIRACKKAFEAEVKIVNWIFNNKDLDFITRDEVIEYIKSRFNKSLESLNIEPLYELSDKWDFNWFDDEVALDRGTDTFAKKATTYSSGLSITENDLF